MDPKAAMKRKIAHKFRMTIRARRREDRRKEALTIREAARIAWERATKGQETAP